MAPWWSSTSASTLPSVVSRPARFPAEAIPFSRRSRCASSTSPPVSTRARLHSIIPAPVMSRSSLTSLALISVTPSCPLRLRLGDGARARRLPEHVLRGRGWFRHAWGAFGRRLGLRLGHRARSKLPPRSGAAGSASGAPTGSSTRPFVWEISVSVTRLLPAAIPSANTFTISPQERIASSFPGIT